jgi:hypothetical protein
MGSPVASEGGVRGNGAGTPEACHSIDPPLEYQVVHPPLIFSIDFPGQIADVWTFRHGAVVIESHDNFDALPTGLADECINLLRGAAERRSSQEVGSVGARHCCVGIGLC